MIEMLADFFEEMDEMVYISDVEDYTIVYMNKLLRQSLGYRSPEEYRGRHCHEVLQGISKPCDFCNNSKLQPGQFCSWMHKNPLLGKRFLIKDTLFLHQGRRYRLEIAVDVDSDILSSTPYMYSRSENILNECLQHVFSTMNPEESLRRIMAYIGETFRCDRVYVFEMGKHTASNTYEWCGSGVTPQKEILQEVPLSDMAWWVDLFREKKVVTIPDLEEIRNRYPTVYAILKPQKVHCLTAGPISIENKVVGFIGVDNPDPDMLHLVASLFKVIGYFIVSLFKRRDLLRRLNTMSFQDTLTGVYNRNALFDRYAGDWQGESLAVVFCDITGLKQTNDTLGHGAGDQLIRHCCRLIETSLDTSNIFRAGGDEFVAVFENIPQEEFQRRVSRLKSSIQADKFHIAAGYAWSNQRPLRLEDLISQADRVMYQDKRSYYAINRRVPGVERRESARTGGRQRSDSLFYQFLNSTYCDMEMFFQAVSQQNTTSYFYFGDMQKDMFYISDNMRDEFGFGGNIVPGLLQDWAKRIATPRSRELYHRELESMVREKRTIHDMRYQVRTAGGKIIWVRCYGILKWNQDKSLPLFFSGRVTHQDEDFVVDPVTNLPREAALLRSLEQSKKDGKAVRVIGFSLNNVTELNSTRGRAYSDNLARDIAEQLAEELGDKMSFYRLEGMRCAAVVNADCQEPCEKLTAAIRSVVSMRYGISGVSIQRPCSFALLEYPLGGLMPADLLEQLVALIKVAKHEVQLEYVEYSEANLEKTRQLSNMALALSRDVLHGMEHFRVVVQPIVFSRTGGIGGGEVLLRWQFEGQDISPAVFIPLLEKNNMIHLAGRWVFEQAVCSCLRLHSYNPDFYLSFNVSLQQMSDEQFPDFMDQMLTKYGLTGDRLVAEVTESCMDEEPEKLLRFVRMCGEKGIRIALDDFGSGYSSFRMLLQYPSDIIKLDRSLLQEMIESDEKSNFISSVVYACHRFGKKVCMEGVETAEQHLLIRDAGCDMIQGFYCYRPMELDQLYSLLASQCPPEAPQT